MKVVIAVSALLTVILVNLAYADLYKWIDENGGIHFSDRMPTEGAKNLETKTTSQKQDTSVSKRLDTIKEEKPLSPLAEYTEEERRKEVEMLERHILKAQTTCKTRYLTNPNISQDSDYWNRSCAESERNVKESLEILNSDPYRYFYVMHRLKKKDRLELVDDPPVYRPWAKMLW